MLSILLLTFIRVRDANLKAFERVPRETSLVSISSCFEFKLAIKRSYNTKYYTYINYKFGVNYINEISAYYSP